MSVLIETWEKSHPTYLERVKALSQKKLEHNAAKLVQDGFHDIDDHGYIPWSEPIPFERISNHPDGGSYGARCIGENFRRWLEVHPVYINPMSSLAGAWVGTVPGMGGWRPEDRPVHLYPLHQKYLILGAGIGAANHLGPDMRIGLELGWGGILKKIRHYREFNHPSDTSFFDGEENLVLGIQTWIQRHVDKAREMAAVEPDAVLRENLLSIAGMNERLINAPPRTLREACQFLAWFQSVDRMWALGGGLGQLDELLRPYYESDLSSGIHDDEAAIWHIASLFINDTHYSQIGGPASDGHDLASPVSFLILEATHQLKIPMNLALRVHEKLDPALFRKALEYHLQDGTGVCFSLSGGLDKGYARNGFPIGLARMRAKVGCNWTALPGVEYSLQDVTRQSIVQPLLLALDDLMAAGDQPKTMNALWDRYVYHLGVSIQTMKEGFDWHMAHHARNFVEIVLNLFCHGPVERGLDVSEGGVDIVNIAVDGVGLATVADSFAAIEQRVIKEQRLTWERLYEVLKNDYAGAETIRLMLRNIPRYGCGGAPADEWAKKISKTYCDLVKGSRTPNGFNIIPGLFSHGDVLRLGLPLGATPNGRHAGAPISHSSNPDPGFARDGSSGPTAKANAVAATQPGWGNSAPLQLDVDSHLLAETGGIEALEALIKTHNAMGGTLINLNVVSKEMVLAAHADPNMY
ncbi:MAG: pyruvate formate lyase family protein, partial [Omnitrophica WOR_2 bacterium]